MNDLLLSETEVDLLLADAVTQNIELLEERSLEHEQLEVPAFERVHAGMYTRQITIPKGALITGRVWQDAYVDIMLEGDISVASAQGRKRLTGWNVMEGMAGRKRAGYAHQETHWITVHRTDMEFLPGRMLDRMTFFSLGEYRVWYDQRDYELLLAEFGISKQLAHDQARNDSDCIQIQLLTTSVRPSDREGLGLFAVHHLSAGSVILPAMIDGNRTQGGRFVNHSATPNAQMVPIREGQIALVALRDLAAGEEILNNYRDALQLQIQPEEKL